MTALLVLIIVGAIVLTALTAHCEALAGERAREIERLTTALSEHRLDAKAEREATRSEIRRLTKALVILKREHQVLPAQYGDEKWGSYVITNETELAEMDRRQRDEAAGEAVRQADRDLLAQLEGDVI